MTVAAQSCVVWREISMDEELWRLFCTREGESKMGCYAGGLHTSILYRGVLVRR